MHSETLVEGHKPSLKRKAEKHTGEAVNLCYQCGKCSAGCPLAGEMDYAPNQILRMLQLEIPSLDEKILSSYAIWLCLTCETCVTRCPKDVNLPEIMDYLRSESVRQGKVNPKAKDILAFHNAFLDSIKATGRLYEVGLIAGYKMRTMHLLQDVDSAPTLYFNGKLKLFPHMIKNREAISRMFSKAKDWQEGQK